MIETSAPQTPEQTTEQTHEQQTAQPTEQITEQPTQPAAPEETAPAQETELAKTAGPTAGATANAGRLAQSEGFEAMVSAGLGIRWAGRQAIVVRAEGENSSDASLWLFEQDAHGWRATAGPWPAQVGKNGVSKRAEGDGRAPSGAFLLGMAFGRAAKPAGMSYQYRVLDSRDRWVDDGSSPFYNRWVRGAASVCGGGEDLKKITQYKHALVVHYNDDAVKGRGSAIFLHVWLGPGKPTHGCTALSEQNMVELLRWLDYSARPVLVQGTGEQIGRLMEADWGMLCLPPGWGFADDFVPDAQLEIRYNTDDNFTGQRLTAYHSPQAAMRLEAIEALAVAAAELRGDSLGIRIYDAYRPQQATDAMILWAEDASDISTKSIYYPGIDKADIPGQYVARKSAHRLGGTVDLTLLRWGTGKNLDMGAPFDYFGERSFYRYKGLTGAQAGNRALLRNMMIKYGFQPYDKEWWHFTYPVDGEGGDFPILPRERVLN